MSYVNLGILAHVDAGKTSLTERLLFTTGVINRVGSVDAGNTQTDTMALERQRGITIKAAVVSFAIGDVTVNLIDTPGHPDFIAEVERVLSVLDGAVLVISAVEGVQAQTRVLMRVLQRLRIPTLVFINKIDRRGADVERILASIRERLSPAIVAMSYAVETGSRDAQAVPFGPADSEFASQLTELLAERDDTLLAAYLADETAVSYARLRCELAAQTRQALVHPVFVGSAITGAGVDALIAGIKELLPARDDNADTPLSGTVFKVERGPAGEKIAYVRMFSGRLHVRERIVFGNGKEGRVTALHVFEHGAATQSQSVAAGQIGKLWGLGDIQIGDTVGVARPDARQHWFAPPTLETLVVPQHAGERRALHAALTQLAEQDPLINVRRDELRREWFVSLYGEVQKEVLQATLADEYGIAVEFLETTTICVERLSGTGVSLELLGKDDNPFIATVGLRAEPGLANSGIVVEIDVKPETVPLYVYKTFEAFQQALEETAQETLRQGLHGWQVIDCKITLTQSGYVAPMSTARDFRLLMPLVLMAALQRAGTEVCEPMHRFHLEIPADTFGPMLPMLARLRAIPTAPVMRGAVCLLDGDIPAAEVHALQQLLPGMTRGEGVLESAFDNYAPMRGEPPTRPRTDNNPLNRKEYLLHVLRRV